MTQTATPELNALSTIREALENAGADKVFGAPIHQNGLTVLPVAKVSGGGGGGGGHGATEASPEAGGLGGGLGVTAKPVGVFVIKDGTIGWRPVVDLNKIVLGGQIVAVVALFALRAFFRARRRDDQQ